MFPPCSCGNCPICAGRRAQELLERHSRGDARELERNESLVLLRDHCTCKAWPGDEPSCEVHGVADAWFGWALEIVDALGLSAGPRANPADVDGWSVDELRDRIRELAMTCHETREELRDAGTTIERLTEGAVRSHLEPERELVRLVLMAHLEELGDRWPPELPSSYLPDFRIRESSAEDHIDAIIVRLEQATRAAIRRRFFDDDPRE